MAPQKTLKSMLLSFAVQFMYERLMTWAVFHYDLFGFPAAHFRTILFIKIRGKTGKFQTCSQAINFTIY